MEKSKRELYKACENKLEKMRARNLIRARSLDYSSLTDEINAWIMRHDGYSIVIRDIVSADDLVERAKRFCMKKLRRKD